MRLRVSPQLFIVHITFDKEASALTSGHDMRVLEDRRARPTG